MIAFVLDEHYRGKVARILRSPTRSTGLDIDIVCVGDVPDLPRGTPDEDLLIWAEREGRVVVCRDRATMPGHFHAHLAAGRHSPGVFCVRPKTTVAKLHVELELIVIAGDADDFIDRLDYIPY